MRNDARVYNIPTTPDPATEADREATRRVVARNVPDPVERAQVEDMLGLTVFPPSSQAGLASVRVRIS